MNSTSQISESRQIRVFISSTFRDMQRERELLVKTVFPELRRLCDERFVSLTEVDLRWGITKEQQAEGKVLPICLEEIQFCRPYFIGLLGQRYGWIPHAVPPEVLAAQPWIREHVGNRTSVTELEILHGVLRNPAMAGHSFFYFRDPAYIATLPVGEQAEMVERDIPDDIQAFGPEEAARRTQHRKDRLAALKETIRQSSLPLVDPYANPEALAAAVRQKFVELIDQLYPKSELPDPLDQEAIGHRTYARRKLLAYVDRPVHSQAMQTFVDAPATGKGLVVTGDSGGGKTALLAHFAASLHLQEPSFVFEHYFGGTVESASVPRFIHRLLGELKRRACIPDEIPSDPETMAEVLPLWLTQTVEKMPRIVLVLDALNQIEGEPSHRNLSWLPRALPDSVRVVVSSLAGPALDTLRVRGWMMHPLPLADADERGRMIETFLRLCRKQLSQPLRDEIVNASGAANPLFLRTVLEELRQFGDFDHLPDKLRDYLRATTPDELFRQVIRRWRADFHGERDVVDRSLRHLWAVRQGLAENEWLDLLADQQGAMDRQTWRPLFLALASHLVQRSGLWALGHDYLRQAIEAELLSAADQQKQAHLTVANYFERHPAQKEMTPRKAAEWPHQLHTAEAWERLEACLTDIPLFLALYNAKTQWELTAYWQPLRRVGRDLRDCYLTAYEAWIAKAGNAAEVHVGSSIATFLLANAQHLAAERLLSKMLERSERMLGPEHPQTLRIANNLAESFHMVGNYADAEPLLERVLNGRRRALGTEDPETLASMNNLAELLQSKGDSVRAEPLLRETLAVSERILGPLHPQTLGSLNNFGFFLVECKGDSTAAEPYYRRALDARVSTLGINHPSTFESLNNLAFLKERNGDYAGAEALYRQALDGRNRVLGPEHPLTLQSLNNLAYVLEQSGAYAMAEGMYYKACIGLMKLSASINRPYPHLDIFVQNYARCMEKRGMSPSEIRKNLNELGRQFGMSVE